MFPTKIIKSFFLLCLLFSEVFTLKAFGTVIDTIPKAVSAPIVNGISDDDCWKESEWQQINFLWEGQPVDSTDFHGQYKIVWDSSLLYFLVDITDDDFVTGYTFSRSNSNPTSWNYDIVEVFIDEDNSGGLHITNNGAFAYHMACTIPDDGKTVTAFSAGDWNNSVWTNLQSHFQEFAVKRDGKKMIWEFSLKVYNGSLIFDTNEAQARVKLTEGKKMGLSIAYCDADGGYGRDSFIGSVGGNKAGDHYRNADLFGKVILGNSQNIVSTNTNKVFRKQKEDISVYPNPALNQEVTISFENDFIGNIEIELISINGANIQKKTSLKTHRKFNETFQLIKNKSGLYIIKINSGKECKSQLLRIL